MQGLAWANLLDRRAQVLLNPAVVIELVLWHMHDNHAYSILRKILLEFKTSIDGHEHVKLMLRERQERPILQRAPALLMNCGDFVTDQNQLDARIYALVNEDAHSRSWLFAKSRTMSTWSRVIEG